MWFIMKVSNKILSQKQHEKLHLLWQIYGNNGKKHSLTGHKFIQSLVESLNERMRDDSFPIYFEKIKKFYRLKTTDEIFKDVYDVIKSCLFN